MVLTTDPFPEKLVRSQAHMAHPSACQLSAHMLGPPHAGAHAHARKTPTAPLHSLHIRPGQSANSQWTKKCAGAQRML